MLWYQINQPPLFPRRSRKKGWIESTFLLYFRLGISVREPPLLPCYNCQLTDQLRGTRSMLHSRGLNPQSIALKLCALPLKPQCCYFKHSCCYILASLLRWLSTYCYMLAVCWIMLKAKSSSPPYGWHENSRMILLAVRLRPQSAWEIPRPDVWLPNYAANLILFGDEWAGWLTTYIATGTCCISRVTSMGLPSMFYQF